jgi:hypothetical protein
VLGLMAIIGLAAATWVLGSKVGGKAVGPLAAVALVSSPVLLRRSTEYLSDVPSAALLVACMIFIWKQFAERDEPGYGLLWILPFAWAAFYIRYQSALSFALIAVTVAVLFWDEVKAGSRPILVTGLVGFVGLIPHFVFATSETGSPLGILLFTADVSGRQFYGEGLIDYALMLGWPLAAFIGPLAALFCVWWMISGWKESSQRVRCLFLMIPALGQVVTLGVLSHGEARFIFFPLALILIGGVTGFLWVSSRWRHDLRAALTVGLAVLLLGSLAMSGSYVRRAVAGRILGTEPVEMSAELIRETSGDSDCGVMTSYLPQVTYYSACFTTPFRTHLDGEEALSRVEGEELFMLLVEDGKRQPEGLELEDLISLTTGDPITVMGERESAMVFEFED